MAYSTFNTFSTFAPMVQNSVPELNPQDTLSNILSLMSYTRPQQTTTMTNPAASPAPAGNVNYLDTARELAQGAIYDMDRRTLPGVFDCSSYIGRTLFKSGYKVNPHMTTATMPSELTRAGFTQYALTDPSQLQPGDILYRPAGNGHEFGHAEIYLGGGKQIGAHNSTTGVGEANAFGANGSNPYGYTLFFRPAGGNPQMTQAPTYDGWSLPAGTVRGIMKPLPSYNPANAPTQASMGYTKALPDYVKPGFAVPSDLEPIIQEAAQLYHMDPNLIKSIIKQESDFNHRTVSPAGAVGYMQLLADTARDAGVTDRWDVKQNIFGATRYIRQLYDYYKSWPLALAAYNAGPNRTSIRSGQIANNPETKNYVRRVMAYWGMEW